MNPSDEANEGNKDSHLWKEKMMPLTNEQKDCMIKQKSATLTKKVYISALLIKTTTKLRTVVVILINTEWCT